MKKMIGMKNMIGNNLGTIGTAISVTTAILGFVESIVDKKHQDKLIKEQVAKQVAKALNKKR